MLEKIKKNAPLLAFVGLSLLLFWPARDAGFVTDWLGWHYKYRDGAWSDVIHSFGYKGLHPVLHFFNYSLYRLFGVCGGGWYVVFASIHGINAWLLYRLALRLTGKDQFRLVSLGIGFLFLLSPYSVEAVVWRVCLHYLMSLLYCLLCLHFTLDFLEKQRNTSALAALGFFLLGLFSLEWTLVLPGIVVLLLIRFYDAKKEAVQTAALKIVLPMALFIGGYFGLNRWLLGDWVGHYGAKAHLTFEPTQLFGTFGKYFIKHSFFMRNWEHSLKEKYFGFFDQVWLQGLWAFVLIALFLAWVFVRKKLSARIQTAAFAFFAFFVALLPVANLFFYYLLLGENDRYSYMASAFFWLYFGMLLSCLPKKILPFLFAFLMAVSGYFFQKTVYAWKESNEVYQGLLDSYKWADTERVLILGIPDNLEGIYMFRIAGEDAALPEALELFRGIKIKGKVGEANRFNLPNKSAGLKASRETDGESFKVEFAQDGNWWWGTKPGENSLEGKWFKSIAHEWHQEVRLLEIYPDAVFLYPVGKEWKEVK